MSRVFSFSVRGLRPRTMNQGWCEVLRRSRREKTVLLSPILPSLLLLPPRSPSSSLSPPLFYQASPLFSFIRPAFPPESLIFCFLLSFNTTCSPSPENSRESVYSRTPPLLELWQFPWFARCTLLTVNIAFMRLAYKRLILNPRSQPSRLECKRSLLNRLLKIRLWKTRSSSSFVFCSIPGNMNVSFSTFFIPKAPRWRRPGPLSGLFPQSPALPWIVVFTDLQYLDEYIRESHHVPF